jgi:hypothetical protein
VLLFAECVSHVGSDQPLLISSINLLAKQHKNSVDQGFDLVASTGRKAGEVAFLTRLKALTNASMITVRRHPFRDRKYLAPVSYFAPGNWLKRAMNCVSIFEERTSREP